jgi:hypothetical protein
MKFHLFRMSFGCDFSRFSDLLDFSKSCLPKSVAMRNFNKVEFSDAISGKFARLRFSDIYNPSLRLLHRWMSFTLFPMAELYSVTNPELQCMFAMVNRIKYTPVADIVDYFKNVPKMSGPIECYLHGHSDCHEPWPTLRGMYLFLVLTILFTCTSCARNPIILYLCCMVARRYGYLTRAFDCTPVKFLYYSLIGWQRRATASQDHLTLIGEITWRQHSRPQLHHWLTIRGPSGTLGTEVTSWVTMRVVTTPLMVIPSVPSEPEPSPLPGTMNGMLLWSNTSVMGFTRLSARLKGLDDSSDGWMTLHICHTRFLHQNQVIIICMTQDQFFHTYGQKCS